MNFVEFAETLKNDAELREKFQACTKPEEAYALAAEAGLSISPEEFQSYMNKISSVAVELSDEDLEAISAGCGHSETAIEVTFKVLEGLSSLACV